MLTAARLRELLHYDPVSGEFTWLVSGNGRKAGRIAGLRYPDAEGYSRIRVDGTTHYAHRLAVLYMTGEWPQHVVDHRNGEKRDNSWDNLRDVPQSINQHNRRMPRNNTSGHHGVHWNSSRRKWVAGIKYGGRNRNLGGFVDINDAIAARRAAEAAFA